MRAIPEIWNPWIKANKHWIPAMPDLGGGVLASFVEATHMRLIEDAVFFAEQSAESVNDIHLSNRYARTAIMYSAFYVESLSHLFHMKLGPAEAALVNRAIGRDTDALPGPLKRLRASYRILSNNYEPSIDGLIDLFEIRNQLFGHAAGLTEEIFSGAPRERVDREMRCKQFLHFPYTLSQFTISHAETVLAGLNQFLADFLAVLQRPVPPELTEALRPVALADHLHRVSAYCHWIEGGRPLWDDWRDWFETAAT